MTKRTSTYKKRRYRPIPMHPVPDRQIVKMKYADSVALDPGSSGNVSVHTFSCNSLYDPDVTGVGHQPKSFDEFENFYNHYTVLGSKIKVTFTSMDDSATAGSYAVGIYIDDNSTPPSTIIDLMEERKNSYKVVTAADSGKSSSIVTSKLSCKKFFGMPSLIGESNYRGVMGNFAIGSSPIEQAYYQVWATALDATTDSAPIRLLVEIEYIAMLTERKELGRS